MRLFEFDQNSIIDNVNGIGAVPINQNVNYLGLKVKTTPLIFLKLAAPIESSNATSTEYIKQQLQQGGKIGAPWLQIFIPHEWEKNNFTKPAKVVAHEGRNRMRAVLDLFGNKAIETHLFFSRGLRKHHISTQWIEQLNKKLVPEKSSIAIDGPFFTV